MSAAPKVYAAINAVANLLSKVGISKDQENIHQRFMFRGIDDVYSALARPLVDSGLRVFPRVIARETTERATAKGGTAFATVLTVEYDFVSVEDGTKHTACVVGEAADTGDKSHSKALSMAFKYACFQTFCIPVEGEEDADATTHDLRPARQIDNSKAGAVAPSTPAGEKASGASAPAADRKSALVDLGKSETKKHPLLVQLEQALDKYGSKRAVFEAKIAEAMDVATIDLIPIAKLPTALVRVMDHQKAVAASKAPAEKPAAGKKPAGKKAALKEQQPPARPPADQQNEEDDVGNDDDLPV